MSSVLLLPSYSDFSGLRFSIKAEIKVVSKAMACMARSMLVIMHIIRAKIFLTFCNQETVLTVDVLDVVVPEC